MARLRKASGKNKFRSSGGSGSSGAGSSRKGSSRSGQGAGSKPTHRAGRSKPLVGGTKDNTRDKKAGTEGLYLVATPIGNAGDITLRALELLKTAHVIACEDTRVTAQLAAIHDIETPLTPYHEHNAERARPLLMKRLKRGETVALVSDAGTPLVSDPGYKLVRACIEEGVSVTALPGPSSVLAGLSLSGLPTDRFLFAGFLPPRQAGRRKALDGLRSVQATLVFMESAKRLAASVADMARVLGPRQAAVAREMTKKFEEVRRGPLDELAAHYNDAGPPRGEVTVVVAPPGKDAAPGDEEVDQRILLALQEGSVRDAADRVAAETGLARRRIYARALELRKARKPEGEAE